MKAKPNIKNWREEFDERFVNITYTGGDLVEPIKDFIQSLLLEAVEEIKLPILRIYSEWKSSPPTESDLVRHSSTTGYNNAVFDLEAKKIEIIKEIGGKSEYK